VFAGEKLPEFRRRIRSFSRSILRLFFGPESEDIARESVRDQDPPPLKNLLENVPHLTRVGAIMRRDSSDCGPEEVQELENTCRTLQKAREFRADGETEDGGYYREWPKIMETTNRPDPGYGMGRALSGGSQVARRA
jgi:hypothetical protein